ncbi:hypothetical protein OG871_02420 [Kitasatospora sp. NBC_00374]|uniref:hypothetical protein n=1 Tax=Kitasatospora sp. NBC_00374 TaxID=2975964 RepID=UPI0030E316E1
MGSELAPDRRLERLRVLSDSCHRRMTLLRRALDTTIAALAALAMAALVTAA